MCIYVGHVCMSVWLHAEGEAYCVDVDVSVPGPGPEALCFNNKPTEPLQLIALLKQLLPLERS